VKGNPHEKKIKNSDLYGDTWPKGNPVLFIISIRRKGWIRKKKSFNQVRRRERWIEDDRAFGTFRVGKQENCVNC